MFRDCSSPLVPRSDSESVRRGAAVPIPRECARLRPMHDLVIRNGNVVDGTGAPGFVGDVAISDGVITAVGTVDERGAREIDADGAVVTPGFVDIHTHFD